MIKDKIFLARRGKYSHLEAISLISKYGVAKVIGINKESIIEEFVRFDKMPLTINQLARLAKQIHANKRNNLSLVHGDFSSNNTTLFLGVPRCYDYEHAHFGNIYVDIGRVILRDCNSLQEVEYFFKEYRGDVPSMEELISGLIVFCDWQNKLRVEKNAPYQEVPLVRKARLKRAPKDITSIINSFKEEVK
jgi:hypothetical protein